MSKASEWIERRDNAVLVAARLTGERPKLFVDGMLSAEVGQNGECIVHIFSTNSERALKIAAWIIDTFGDTPTSPTSEGDSK